MSRKPTEMELRVAQAICEAQGLAWDMQGNPMTSGSGGDDRDGFILEARAAIRAMREPTAEMTAYVRAKLEGTIPKGPNDWYTEPYRNMIDAASPPEPTI